MLSRRFVGRIAFLMLLLGVVALGRTADAQKGPPPLPPNPQAPTITALSATGMQRGTTLEVILTGTNLANPTGFHTSFPAKVTLLEDKDKAKQNSQLHVRLEVPAEAALGYHTIRLATSRGISNLRIFCIDDLPQVDEVTTNRDKSVPQILPVPCVVSSKLDAEKSSWFQFHAKAGDRLSFDVIGRRLGGPIDPQLSLYDAKTKREIAFDNDSPGCQSDPRISYLFKSAGDFLIEVKDVLNRGGADYAFRLRVGDFPLAVVPIPMGVQRGKKTTVDFAGPAVAGVAPVTVEGPTDLTVQTVRVAPRGANGLHGWPVILTVSDFPELVAREANHDPSTAIRIPVPGAFTGRFLKSDQPNYCIFGAKKGQKVLVEAQTLELGSPSLVYMILRNAKTKAEIAKTNPQANPPLDQVIDFTAQEDGDYLIEVQHLNYLGGPSEAFRLTVTPSRPSFEISLGLDRFDVAQGGFVPLTLQVKRNNFAGPIDVAVHGMAGLKGQTTIPASQATGVVVLHADQDMAMGPAIIKLVASATIDKETVKQLVSVRPAVSASLANLPLPPPEFNTQVAVAVREHDPFALVARLDQNGCVPGLPAKLTLTVERDKGFDSEIVLNPPANLPPGVAPPKLPSIPKGQKEMKVTLDINGKVPTGQYPVVFSGKGKLDGREFAVATLPVVLEVAPQPFELLVEPSKVTLEQGSKTKITVKAVRRGGYDGPIQLDVKNLPAKVTAGKATIAKDQTSAELELAAADDAAAGSKMDVQIGGQATGLGNAAGTSPNFTVIVEKK
jgi:hypothetical protein